MTPKEVVLSGYEYFARGDMESLNNINHPNARFIVNGHHQRSGEYQGFADFRDNILVHIPNDFPNFSLEIEHVVAEGDRVHVFVKCTADNLDAHGVHIFLVEDGLQKEFTIVDDSQKIAAAHAG